MTRGMNFDFLCFDLGVGSKLQQVLISNLKSSTLSGERSRIPGNFSRKQLFRDILGNFVI